LQKGKQLGKLINLE